MYNIFIALGTAIVVFAVLFFATDVSWWVCLAPALLVFAAVYLLLVRMVMKKVNGIMEAAGKDLQGQRVEKAIRTLKEALRYGPWQFSVTGQVHSQIGMIYYMKRDFSNAFPYLEKGFSKNWVSMGMLAVSYMKRNKKDSMTNTFEKAVQWSPKESLLWNLYAYCVSEGGDTEKAKQILERGRKKLPGDERIAANLEALKEGRKMKMKSFGDMWLQFHLERQSVIMKQQAAALGGTARRKIIRK
ncbi:MAG TPA: tetratricopeptide repeat protein [Geobacteraceae bacterium]|nr:tetratricopeptide repeat protein [Geobacteraceae bacterium]